MSDQGGEFENRLLKKLNELAGVSKSRTTPYHPQCNGMVERMNETLIGMLRTLPRTQKGNWPEAVNKMCHAYNSTKHSVTGYSPYFLLFGREPILPIDLLIGLDEDSPITQKTYQQFANKWKSQMEDAYRIAREKTKQRRKEDQERWNRKQLLSELQPGCRVLVRNYNEKGGPGKHKLRSFWEEDIYIVEGIHDNLKVVYKIRKENSKNSKLRVVHRNMIMPVDDDFMKEALNKLKPTNKQSNRQHKNTRDELGEKNDVSESRGEENSTDEEFIEGIWHPNEAPILHEASTNTVPINHDKKTSPMYEITDGETESSDNEDDGLSEYEINSGAGIVDNSHSDHEGTSDSSSYDECEVDDEAEHDQAMERDGASTDPERSLDWSNEGPETNNIDDKVNGIDDCAEDSLTSGKSLRSDNTNDRETESTRSPIQT